MAKSRNSADPGKKAKGGAKGAGARKAKGAVDALDVAARADRPADAAPRAASPTRRQVRQIARLVARLEAVGELEAHRRRQLQVALEKGRKTKRHRQQVDRAAGRVGELIDRLRTLARGLDSPVAPSGTKPARKSAPATSAADGAARKAAARRPPAAASKPGAAGTRAKPAAAAATAKPAAPRTRPKPADA